MASVEDRSSATGVRAPEDEVEFEDRSLLRPSFSRHYFRLAFRLLPRAVTANFVTLAGFAATCLLLPVVLAAGRLSTIAMAGAFLVGTQLYVVGDHLDGMQAVASRTTSPLGEFLDHWLDLTSGSILGLAAFALMPGVGPGLFYGVMLLYLAAFVVTYVERAERRSLYFAPVGSLEGIAILSAFFAAHLLPAGRGFFQGASLPWGLPGWWILVGVAGLCFGGTVVVIGRRMGGLPPHFLAWGGLGMLTVAGLTSLAAVGRPTGWLVLTLFAADYLARLMHPELFPRRGKAPDAVGPGLVAGAALLPAAAGWIVSAALLWLAGRAVGSAGRVLDQHREHWRWVNPPVGGD